MTIDPKIREAIECYGSTDDRSAPEWVDLAEQLEHDSELRQLLADVEAEDVLLREAMVDVDVPTGLEQRLLAALDDSANGTATVDAAADPIVTTTADADAAVDKPASASVGERVRRRRIVLGLGSLAAAVVVGIAVVWTMQPAEPLASERIGHWASSWERQVDEAAAWQATSSPAGYEKPAVVRPAVQRWQPIRQLDHIRSSAVVYDLKTNGSPLRLYVIDLNQRPIDLPTNPFKTLVGTGNIAVAAWQSEGRLYVLVGDRRGPALISYIERLPIT